MSAKEFLKSKGIKKPTYEGVRLVGSEMEFHRIIDILEEYLEISTGIKSEYINGEFILFNEGAIGNIYWNGALFQDSKKDCPTFSFNKANEYAKVLGCKFTDKN